MKMKTEDILCGFRAFKLSLVNNNVLENICNDMGFPIEFIGVALKNGSKIIEVPVKVRYNNSSKRGLTRKVVQLLQILRSLIRITYLKVDPK